jgi:hypothetical protein
MTSIQIGSAIRDKARGRGGIPARQLQQIRRD